MWVIVPPGGLFYLYSLWLWVSASLDQLSPISLKTLLLGSQGKRGKQKEGEKESEKGKERERRRSKKKKKKK